MINDFLTFLKESKDNQDSIVCDFFMSLTRNYESKKMFYTDLVQYYAIEEIKDWNELHKRVKLDQSLTQDMYYSLVFKLDNKEYALSINFTVNFTGKKEKDAPETATETDLARLNIVLTGLKIKRIRIDSNSFNYTERKESISPEIRSKCKNFLIKMLKSDYDTLSPDLTSMEHD